MKFRVIAQEPADYEAWLEGQREGPAVELADSDAENLFTSRFSCSNCHTVTDPGASTYGPNLTHLASREVFASGYYELTRERLIEWLLDAPSLVPMQTDSETCRTAAGGTEGCVGMPSFTRYTPADKKAMTREEAEILADYLLSLT
jgi:cytochrome c oxidase subunit 2